MRIEQFMPTSQHNYCQFYVNCAHINIIGPGGGTPTGFARFPGTYQIDDPGVSNPLNTGGVSGDGAKYVYAFSLLGLKIPFNQDENGGFVPNDELRLFEYQAPGPAVWTG